MSAAAAIPTEALVLIAWSRVWSPVIPKPLFEAAWQALDLPGDAAAHDTEYFSTFHAGFPAPRVPLLLHVALDRPGDSVRMDFLRLMSHLNMTAGDHMLAPDHLAIACEVVARAIADDEPVIVREIAERYLLPWCAVSARRLPGMESALRGIVERFRMLAESLSVEFEPAE